MKPLETALADGGDALEQAAGSTLVEGRAGLATAEGRAADEDDGALESERCSPRTIEAASGLLEEMDWERLPPFPVPWRHPLKASAWLIRATFGVASLLLLLAVLAAIPLVNFLALGYLLDAEGRVARTGRLRTWAPLFPLAPRFGAIALGLWLWLWPLRLFSSLAADAELIDPASTSSRGLRVFLIVLWVGVTLHMVLALARGGGFWTWFRPIKNVRWLWGNLRRHEYWTYASASIRRFVERLELRRVFVLGLQGFGTSFAWLLLPTALLAFMREEKPGPALITITGGLWLAWAFSWAPFLQARFAAEQHWRAGFAVRETRRLSGYAPIAWLLATVLVCVLSLPLYLFKIVLLPRDAMWGVTLVFIASIYPARIATGWAYHRAVARREAGLRANWFLRAGCRLLAVGVVAAYVFLLFFTQFLGEHGKRTLFEHHALLLPWAG